MKGRKHRETGGVNEAEEDVKTKPENRSYTGKDEGPSEEAEEMKKGGRAKRRSGGKLLGKVEGHEAPHHAGRKPRKSGGKAEEHERAGMERREAREKRDREHEREGEERKHRARGGRSTSDANPLTSANRGSDPPGRKVMKGEPGAFGED